MPNFFISDKNGTKHSFNEQQLKALAAQGRITPTTPLESDTGHKGLAGQIPGLFATPVQQVTQPQPIPASMAVNVPSPAELTDIQPICAELLGMKPEVLFALMFLSAIFSFSIVTFFIPIIIWALTKEKDKRADLYGIQIIIAMVCQEGLVLMMFFGLLIEFPMIVFTSAIGWLFIFVLLIVRAFYVANGYIPIRRGKRVVMVYCPSPAISAVPQHATASVMSGTSIDEIKKMKELLDCGAITQEEFDAFKKKTLRI